VPELPEVETIRRQLEPALVGRRLTATRILDDRWSHPTPPAELVERIQDRRVESVKRRGKYLLVGLQGDRWLAMHLRMTGNLILVEAGAPIGPVRSDEHPSASARDTAANPAESSAEPSTLTLGGKRLYEAPPGARHLRAEIELDDGSRLWFTDPRRFGRALVLDGPALEQYLDERLGVEPLSDGLTAEVIGALTASRRTPLKSFLLGQKAIAGIGNIYADEALHRAELHPLSPAGSTRPEHWEPLRQAIVETLERGIERGGASIDDYRDARGETGEMQDEFLVHTREGEPCPRCEEPIRRIVVSGRSTYFCPACQKRLRKRRHGSARSRSASADRSNLAGSSIGAKKGSKG